MVIVGRVGGWGLWLVRQLDFLKLGFNKDTQELFGLNGNHIAWFYRSQMLWPCRVLQRAGPSPQDTAAWTTTHRSSIGDSLIHMSLGQALEYFPNAHIKSAAVLHTGDEVAKTQTVPQGRRLLQDKCSHEAAAANVQLLSGLYRLKTPAGFSPICPCETLQML